MILPKATKSYLYIFSLVALFILLIACFNYINLAIAQSTRRSIEVGVRKATGASSGQLILQFLGEALMIAFLAMGLSMLLVELSLPFFNQLAGKNFPSGLILNRDTLLLYSIDLIHCRASSRELPCTLFRQTEAYQGA